MPENPLHPTLRFVPAAGRRPFEAVVMQRVTMQGGFDLPIPSSDSWVTLPQAGGRQIRVKVVGPPEYFFDDATPPNYDVWVHCNWNGRYE